MTNKVETLELALIDIVGKYEKISFSSSLSAEDMVLLHIIARHNLPIEVFTLDTGRLHEETYHLMDEIQKAYPQRLKVYFPDAANVEAFVAERGVNDFYRSIDSRKTCCRVRKVEPLRRALKNRQVWISGLRREQSVTRESIEVFAWDESFSIYKFNPLLDWTSEDVWQFIKDNNVPYNTLHDGGFPSIGCSPCTRAISAGEDERAGRWWWENPETKECGLHVKTTPVEDAPQKIVA